MSETPQDQPNPQPEAAPPVPKKVDPALVTFARNTLDTVAIAANELNGLKDAKDPLQILEGLTRVFDKLALKCQREAILRSEAAKPRQINPLVEITGINVAKALENTARDLRNGAGLPSTYEETADILKGQTKTVPAFGRGTSSQRLGGMPPPHLARCK